MMWKQWVNFVVGLWIVASAYMGFTADTMVTNLTIAGIIVAVLSFWEAVQTNRVISRPDSRYERHA